MVFKKNIVQYIAALALSLALVLPMAIQFSHVFEHHEHVTCTDTKVHLHEKKIDCSVCDFHLSSFAFSITDWSDAHGVNNYNKPVTSYSIEVYANTTDIPSPRGPPSLFS